MSLEQTSELRKRVLVRLRSSRMAARRTHQLILGFEGGNLAMRPIAAREVLVNNQLSAELNTLLATHAFLPSIEAE